MIEKESKMEISRLTDENLLQVFMPKKAVVYLIKEHHNLYHAIMNTTEEELSTIESMDVHKVAKIQYLKELFLQFQDEQRHQKQVIHCPKDIADYCVDMQHLQQEQFRVLILNSKNDILAEKMITQGTLDASLVSPREVFYIAVKYMAARIAVVHNHPSGNPTPSSYDIATTDLLVKAGKLMNIDVLDHVIIGKNQFYSLKENNLLEKQEPIIGPG